MKLLKRVKVFRRQLLKSSKNIIPPYFYPVNYQCVVVVVVV